MECQGKTKDENIYTCLKVSEITGWVHSVNKAVCEQCNCNPTVYAEKAKNQLINLAMKRNDDIWPIKDIAFKAQKLGGKDFAKQILLTSARNKQHGKELIEIAKEMGL